jgi:hypothetical protein
MDIHSLFDYVLEQLPERERADVSREQRELLNKAEPPVNNPQAQILELRNRPPKSTFNPQLARRRDEEAIPRSPQVSSLAVERSSDIPRLEMRKRRSLEPENSIGMRLRPEENTLPLEVGRFRVIATADVCRALYAGNDGRMKRDLAFLRQNRLIDVHLLTARRGGRSESAHGLVVT